jgi:hypothetical protein
MGTELISMQPMVENMLVTSKMMKNQVMELIHGQMEAHILENGHITCQMDLEEKNGLMEPFMKATLKMDYTHAAEPSHGQTENAYEGNFENGLFNGYGKITCHDQPKRYYIGQFENGKKHGNGIVKWANGDFYEGQWINDILNGYGKFQWSNGDSTSGNFYGCCDIRLPSLLICG